MSADLKIIKAHAYDFWFARIAIALVAVLQLLLVNNLTLGPRWFAPALEVALLVPLSIATGWTQASAAQATTHHHWLRIARVRRYIRASALVLTGLITVVNGAALIELVHGLLHGSTARVGRTLLVDALIIWCINVIVFALWFWSIDRGGPATRGLATENRTDFLFPQASLGGEFDGWSPGFVDYLYLSFTNATAFSPTDVLPLSRRAKLLMMGEAGISLLTIAFVAARAVNILA